MDHNDMSSKWKYQVFDTPCFPARWKVGRFEDDTELMREPMLTTIDREILDLLRQHKSYEEIRQLLGVTYTHINKLHRKHFPT